jgi:peptidoglycan/LPS O-acetylase OafA/YrhL
MKNRSAHSDSNRLEPLTTIRFFGAVCVVACHWLSMGAPILTPRHAVLWRAFHLGASCVSGFFVLSGFILAWVYLREPGPLDKHKFFVARFARIYPIFLLTLILDTPSYFASSVATLGVKGAILKTGIAFGSCLLMLQAWGKQLWGMDFPNWSLSVETFCYLLFPVVGRLLWRLRGRWIWIGMLTLYAGGQALVTAGVMVARLHGVSPIILYFLPPLHLYAFLIGVLVARLQVSEVGAPAGSHVESWMVYAAMGFALCAGIALLAVPSSIADSIVGTTLIRDGCLSPVFGLVIWALSIKSTRGARWLSAPWLVLLGEGSFALYLLHVPVFHLIHPVLLRLLGDMPWGKFRLLYGLAFLIYLTLCIALSVASFLWVEAPARRWLNRRLGIKLRHPSHASVVLASQYQQD